jgi:hypothetical protein
MPMSLMLAVPLVGAGNAVTSNDTPPGLCMLMTTRSTTSALAFQHPCPLPLEEEEHDMSPCHCHLLLHPPQMTTSKMMMRLVQFCPTSPPSHAGTSTTASTYGAACAKAISHIAQLKPGHKASTTSKCRWPCGDTNEWPAHSNVIDGPPLLFTPIGGGV